jgi:hypothetical protein
MGWVGVALPGATAAQDLSQLHLAYLSAQRALDAHRLSSQAQEQLWYAAMDSLRLAQAQGSRDRMDTWDRRHLAEANELSRLVRVVGDAERGLAARRSAYLDALERELDGLARSYGRSTSPAERMQLSTRINSLEAEAAQLRQEEAAATRISPTVFQSVRVNALDLVRLGQAGIRRVIDNTDRQIADHNAAIAQIDDRIARLRRRLERDRLIGDGTNSLTRFGSGDPVGASRPRDPSATPAPGTVLSPEEEIEALQIQRGLLEQLQRELRSQVAELRERVPNGGDR